MLLFLPFFSVALNLSANYSVKRSHFRNPKNRSHCRKISTCDRNFLNKSIMVL
ncbi:hypothetical protein GXM_03350 [Nostoc sphaeroides CCNUC1]|uniref:Uncharacterized protein n=1 Tax=Nostoc sphaeroides CCNUC1 TaxID=2653204 RepID=A0A5P8VZV4_9NOSO|nr:hypothetical protein GXM_03350 [Nostoc sphaeroides CCNUC1]